MQQTYFERMKYVKIGPKISNGIIQVGAHGTYKHVLLLVAVLWICSKATRATPVLPGSSLPVLSTSPLAVFLRK